MSGLAYAHSGNPNPPFPLAGSPIKAGEATYGLVPLQLIARERFRRQEKPKQEQFLGFTQFLFLMWFTLSAGCLISLFFFLSKYSFGMLYEVDLAGLTYFQIWNSRAEVETCKV